MTTPVVRLAQLRDAQDIRRINRDALGYDYPQQETIARLKMILNSPYNCIWVMDTPSGVVGYIHASDYDTTYGPSQKNIMALAVDPSAQGMGYGRMLIQAAEAWAKQSGAQGMRLISGHDRVGAHAFYRACGYTMRKEQKNFVKALD